MSIAMISGLNSPGSRVASATATYRRCTDKGGDHHRPVDDQARCHHVCAAPSALRLGRSSSRAMPLAAFILELRGAGSVCSLPARGNTGLSLTA